MQQNYHIVAPTSKKKPILVSVPHCGTAFPADIAAHYQQQQIARVDDTDFFVHKIYDFVTEMGITLIYAHYSRWVIDLNRSPENKALYTDGRIITGLTPRTDFLGNPIYKSAAEEPDYEEIERRKERYFQPYYNKITEILNSFKTEFGQAILWDAHSIRRQVSTIQEAPFPNFILGTNDGKTASEELIQAAKSGLTSSTYDLTYNTPFKGGNITRHFGNPEQGIHALQLEMIKTLYMDDAERQYHLGRANKLRHTLKFTLDLLGQV